MECGFSMTVTGRTNIIIKFTFGNPKYNFFFLKKSTIAQVIGASFHNHLIVDSKNDPAMIGG